MAKTVGFACSIKLQWIKRTIQLLEEGHDKESFKKEHKDKTDNISGSSIRPGDVCSFER